MLSRVFRSGLLAFIVLSVRVRSAVFVRVGDTASRPAGRRRRRTITILRTPTAGCPVVGSSVRFESRLSAAAGGCPAGRTHWHPVAAHWRAGCRPVRRLRTDRRSTGPTTPWPSFCPLSFGPACPSTLLARFRPTTRLLWVTPLVAVRVSAAADGRSGSGIVRQPSGDLQSTNRRLRSLMVCDHPLAQSHSMAGSDHSRSNQLRSDLLQLDYSWLDAPVRAGCSSRRPSGCSRQQPCVDRSTPSSTWAVGRTFLFGVGFARTR